MEVSAEVSTEVSTEVSVEVSAETSAETSTSWSGFLDTAPVSTLPIFGKIFEKLYSLDYIVFCHHKT